MPAAEDRGSSRSSNPARLLALALGASARSPMRRFVRDLVAYAPATGVPAGLALLSAALFTRMFTTGEYGKFSLVLAISGPLVAVLGQVAGQPVGRFYAEYEQNGQLDLYKRTAAALAIATLCVAAAVSIPLFALVTPFSDGAGSYLLATGAVTFVCAQSVAAVFEPILSSSGRTRPYRRAAVWSACVALGVSVLLVLVSGANAAWLMWGPAVASVLTIPYVWIAAGMSSSHLSFAITKELRSTLRRFWSYGSPMAIWFFAAALLAVGDRYVIQFDLGSSVLGIYSLSYTLGAGAAGLVGGPVALAALPILARQWAAGDVAAAQRTLTKMTEVYLLVGFGLVGLAVLLAQLVCSVFLGSAYSSGCVVIAPVFAGGLVWGLSMLGHKGIEFRERTALLAWDALFAGILNLILNIIFVPKFGMIASAYATLASYAVYTAVIWAQSRRLLAWNIPWRSAGIAAGAAILAGLVAAAASSVVEGLWLRISITAAIFVGGYVALLVGSGVIRPEQMQGFAESGEDAVTKDSIPASS
jgi:O-antigen/teichoic acid export membrane protein